MLFKRFYDDNLAQASYLIACERTREAAVVDPNLDIAQYIRAAGAERVRITNVTETHIHADFVSGAQALAAATGATVHLSAEGRKIGDTRAMRSNTRSRCEMDRTFRSARFACRPHTLRATLRSI